MGRTFINFVEIFVNFQVKEMIITPLAPLTEMLAD